MKAILKKIRLPRKIMFIVAGVLVLSGASGAFAVYSAKDELLGTTAAPSISGLACTTLETLKVRRNGQRWIRKYVTTASAGGIDRVRTALRVTGLLANAEKADFYQVVVLDETGPADRAGRRGAAIGAEVLFAPEPRIVPGMPAAFVARYNDAEPNLAGLFHGREVSLTSDEIQRTMTAIDDKSDCFDPSASAAGAEGSEAGAKPAEATEPGHGEEKPGDAHAEAATVDGEADKPAH